MSTLSPTVRAVAATSWRAIPRNPVDYLGRGARRIPRLVQVATKEHCRRGAVDLGRFHLRGGAGLPTHLLREQGCKCPVSGPARKQYHPDKYETCVVAKKSSPEGRIFPNRYRKGSKPEQHSSRSSQDFDHNGLRADHCATNRGLRGASEFTLAASSSRTPPSPPRGSRHSRAFANRNQYACGPEFARTRQPRGTAIRNCATDEGRPFAVRNQVLNSSYRKAAPAMIFREKPCRIYAARLPRLGAGV
jgi:hypothetical protein